jgi:hypothetical protein
MFSEVMKARIILCVAVYTGNISARVAHREQRGYWEAQEVILGWSCFVRLHIVWALILNLSIPKLGNCKSLLTYVVTERSWTLIVCMWFEIVSNGSYIFAVYLRTLCQLLTLYRSVEREMREWLWIVIWEGSTRRGSSIVLSTKLCRNWRGKSKGKPWTPNNDGAVLNRLTALRFLVFSLPVISAEIQLVIH